jgi:hypothetical protein
VTEATLGVLVVVEHFPVQLGRLFPAPGRTRKCIKASASVLQRRSASTIYDPTQRNRRLLCNWKEHSQEVPKAARVWHRHANVTDLDGPTCVQQARQEETHERLASGGVPPPKTPIPAPSVAGLKRTAPASSEEPNASEPEDASMCHACDNGLPLTTCSCESAVVYRIVREQIRGKRPRDSLTKREPLQWWATALPPQIWKAILRGRGVRRKRRLNGKRPGGPVRFYEWSPSAPVSPTALHPSTRTGGCGIRRGAVSDA